MVNWQNKKTGDLLLLANGIVLVILLNLLASLYPVRVDLTEERRYSIKDATKQLLQELDDNVYVEVYLTGELNAGFRRFQKSIRETLEEFRIYSGNKVQVNFIDPSAAVSEKSRNEFMADLSAKGIQPTRVVDTRNGQRSEKIIFPGALVSYGGFETGVMLLKGNKGEEDINQSIEGLEYEIASTIYKLVNKEPKHIAFVKGHGELDSLDIASFTEALLDVYDVTTVDLTKSTNLSEYDAIVIVKPRFQFSESARFALDQYIMNGGKALFLLDKLQATMDSASRGNYLAVPYALNLDDMLFKYGVRINYDLVQDLSSARYPIVIGETGGKPRMQMLDWPFFPLINHYAEHPITRNLDMVSTKFISSIDTVSAKNVKKTMLLTSSQYARVVGAPVNISVDELIRNVKSDAFSKSYIPVACLLEGCFTSVFKGRFLPEGVDASKFKDTGSPAKIIVMADGDIARNEINRRTGQPHPLGFDAPSNYTFANKELLLNAVAYLVDDSGLINARSKSIKIRPLDRGRVAEEKTKWQIINISLPLLLMVIIGIVRGMIRKRKFASF